MASQLCHPAPIIRPATISDHRTMANIFALAFWDETLFGYIMHPYRQLYPCDFALYALQRVRTKYWNWTHRVLVSTVRDRGSGREIVTGWADWARVGPEEKKKMGLKWWDPRQCVAPIVRLFTRVSTLIWPNRAANPCHLRLFVGGALFIKDLWSGPRAECWNLETIAVSPDYAGLGHGHALVKWDLDQAANEGVCASVTSAPGKEAFYQNFGFNSQEGRAGQGNGDPAAYVPGGLIFWKLTETAKFVDQKSE